MPTDLFCRDPFKLEPDCFHGFNKLQFLSIDGSVSQNCKSTKLEEINLILIQVNEIQLVALNGLNNLRHLD